MVDQIIIFYSKHHGILKITERIGHTPKFSFERVTPPHIEKQISDLNSRKALGYNSIPPKILKDSISIVREPVSQLFNTSVKENLFSLMFQQITPFVSNIISPYLRGFRKG